MKRDERITFQQKTTTYDSNTNEPTETWANVSTSPTMWAKVTPKTATEDYRGDMEGGFRRNDFEVLHRSDIGVENRISWDGKTWDIRGVEMRRDTDRNKILVITAEWRQEQFA